MKRLIIGYLALMIGACTTAPPGSDRYTQRQDSGPDERRDLAQLEEPTPRPEPRSKYGNPETYSIYGKTYRVRDSAEGYRAEGLASWYGKKFHGHRTSSGETYDMYQLTAAHRTLPLPTWARVTNLDNGKSTIVRINDRGPFHPERIIDLSWAAAVKLDIEGSGTGRVRVEAINPEANDEAGQLVSNAPVINPASPPDGLYLQVGAFSRKESARDLVSRLADSFAWPVALQPAENLFRVWVGPFGSDNDRDRARRELVDAGFDTPVRVTP